MGRSAAAALATAFLDALTSVCTLLIAYRLGAHFHRRFLSPHLARPHRAVPPLFAATFALSLSLVLLILFDVLGLMHAATRRLNWLLVVYALVLVLVFVLPVAQVYHVLLDLGWRRPEAARVSLLCEALFLYAFWRIGDPFTAAAAVSPSTHAAAAAALLSIEAATSRLLVVGTTLLALLSGFTAVHLPYSYLTSFIHPIKEKEVKALGARVVDALDAVRDKKLQLLDVERRFAARHPPPHPHRHALVIQGLPPDVIEAEQRLGALFLEYNDAAAAWHDVLYARTWMGRLSTALGALMLLLCGVRVAAALYHIYMHVRGGGLAGKAAAFAISDRVYGVLVRVGVQVDVKVLYQYATLGFTSILMGVNLRAALVRMTAVFALLAGNDALSSSAAIFVAHLMGTYVISSTVLVRSFLPPGSKALISDVLGKMEFQYFQRWFDLLFISSAGIGACVLAYQSGYLFGGARGVGVVVRGLRRKRKSAME